MRALGMGDTEPTNAGDEPEKDENSDISVDDSKSSEIDDENLRKLQAAKEAELLKEAALEYEDVDQIIRDKDGKQIQVTDLLASKVKRLEELNAKNLGKWKGGYKQYQERLRKAAELREMKENPVKGDTWGIKNNQN